MCYKSSVSATLFKFSFTFDLYLFDIVGCFSSLYCCYKIKTGVFISV